MAEQNILAGDINVLSCIRNDLRQYEGNRSKVSSLNQNVSQISKELETLQSSVKNEVENTLKKRREDVTSGYNHAISIDKDKLKQVQTERDKAKSLGIQNRITEETKDLRGENSDYEKQILDAFKLERIPRVLKSRICLALFMTKGVKDVLVCMLLFLVIYMAVPAALVLLVKNVSGLVIVAVCFGLAFLGFWIYKIIADKYVAPHYELMSGVRDTKKNMVKNQKKMKKIRHEIRKDKNEEMYGLEDYDRQINDLYADIEKIEGQRTLALEEFENSTKPDIVAEIEGRDKEKIENMKEELAKKASTLSELQDLVKQQKMYITSNYEAYLGKEFTNISKIDALLDIMKSTSVKTIGQAIMVYDERK